MTQDHGLAYDEGPDTSGVIVVKVRPADTSRAQPNSYLVRCRYGCFAFLDNQLVLPMNHAGFHAVSF